MRELYVYNNESKAGVLREQHSGYGYTFLYDSDKRTIFATHCENYRNEKYRNYGEPAQVRYGC